MPSYLKPMFKSYLALSGKTLTRVIEEYNQLHEPTTISNVNNKLTRGTIKYEEMERLANIIGYDIQWVKREE